MPVVSSILAFSNWYDGTFSDAKISGVEIIHHEVRIAANGAVRLSPTPGQWARVRDLVGRTVDARAGCVETRPAYPELGLASMIDVQAQADGVLLSVDVEQPLPPELMGRAGLNLEFLPSAYSGKGYLVDGHPAVLPRHRSGPMVRAGEPGPIAGGCGFVLAPEDSTRCVSVRANEGEIALFDGRNTVQNGWFVLRSLLPAGRSGFWGQNEYVVDVGTMHIFLVNAASALLAEGSDHPAAGAALTAKEH
ncbi:MAG: Endoglucanase precursor [Chloroflexota bacterium]|jgi:hypothetical protein